MEVTYMDDNIQAGKPGIDVAGKVTIIAAPVPWTVPVLGAVWKLAAVLVFCISFAAVGVHCADLQFESTQDDQDKYYAAVEKNFRWEAFSRQGLLDQLQAAEARGVKVTPYGTPAPPIVTFRDSHVRRDGDLTMPEQWPHSRSPEGQDLLPLDLDPNKRPGRAYVAPNQPFGLSPWSNPPDFDGGHSKPQGREGLEEPIFRQPLPRTEKGQWEPSVPQPKKSRPVEAIRRGEKVAGM